MVAGADTRVADSVADMPAADTLGVADTLAVDMPAAEDFAAGTVTEAVGLARGLWRSREFALRLPVEASTDLGPWPHQLGHIIHNIQQEWEMLVVSML